MSIFTTSPFLRTLETIFPYVYYNNKYINVELGIMEYIHNPIFLLGDWYHDVSLINNNEIKKHINWSYESIVSEIDFNLLEEEKDLENRLIKFFNEMLIKDKDKTVLIVSHEGVINKIKDLYLIKTNMKEKFPMGHFEIYELI